MYVLWTRITRQLVLVGMRYLWLSCLPFVFPKLQMPQMHLGAYEANITFPAQTISDEHILLHRLSPEVRRTITQHRHDTLTIELLIQLRHQITLHSYVHCCLLRSSFFSSLKFLLTKIAFKKYLWVFIIRIILFAQYKNYAYLCSRFIDLKRIK